MDRGLPASDIDGLLTAIAHRRSLGLARLSEEPVDRAILEKALEAANWAPSNGDTEPWRFSVFTGDSRKKLGDAFAEAYRIGAEEEGRYRPETHEAMRQRGEDAPVWISLGMTPGLLEDGTMKESEEEEGLAVACAVQNLHLVLSAYGLVGMWHSKGASVHPYTASFLGLEAPSRLYGFFFCGWPKVQWPEGERGPWEEKVRWYE
ncbi:nitroreductase [bacterium]|nr:MAG: nitroreductase [bacterium]